MEHSIVVQDSRSEVSQNSQNSPIHFENVENDLIIQENENNYERSQFIDNKVVESISKIKNNTENTLEFEINNQIHLNTLQISDNQHKFEIERRDSLPSSTSDSSSSKNYMILETNTERRIVNPNYSLEPMIYDDLLDEEDLERDLERIQRFYKERVASQNQIKLSSQETKNEYIQTSFQNSISSSRHSNSSNGNDNSNTSLNFQNLQTNQRKSTSQNQLPFGIQTIPTAYSASISTIESIEEDKKTSILNNRQFDQTWKPIVNNSQSENKFTSNEKVVENIIEAPQRLKNKSSLRSKSINSIAFNKIKTLSRSSSAHSNFDKLKKFKKKLIPKRIEIVKNKIKRSNQIKISNKLPPNKNNENKLIFTNKILRAHSQETNAESVQNVKVSTNKKLKTPIINVNNKPKQQYDTSNSINIIETTHSEIEEAMKRKGSPKRTSPLKLSSTNTNESQIYKINQDIKEEINENNNFTLINSYAETYRYSKDLNQEDSHNNLSNIKNYRNDEIQNTNLLNNSNKNININDIQDNKNNQINISVNKNKTIENEIIEAPIPHPQPEKDILSTHLQTQLMASLSSSHYMYSSLQHNLNTMKAEYESYIQSLRLRINEGARNDDRTMKLLKWLASELFVLHRERSTWKLNEKLAPLSLVQNNLITDDVDDIDFAMDDDYQFLRKVELEYIKPNHSKKWRNDKSVGFLLEQNLELQVENKKLKAAATLTETNRKFLEQNVKKVVKLEKALKEQEKQLFDQSKLKEDAQKNSTQLYNDNRELYKDNVKLTQIIQDKENQINELENMIDDLKKDLKTKKLLSKNPYYSQDSRNYSQYSIQKSKNKFQKNIEDLIHPVEFSNVSLPGENTVVEKGFELLSQHQLSKECQKILKTIHQAFRQLEEENLELKVREREYRSALSKYYPQ